MKLKMPPKFNRLWLSFLLFFSVIGPGIISANADNDAGGITTYSIVGAHYGTKLLWVLLLITVSLAITQEMGVRMGLVTHQGLGGIIRGNFGVRWTMLAMVGMLLANIGTIAAEFAGTAAALSIGGLSKYYTIPLVVLLVWLILYKGSFKITQKIFLIFSTFYIVYIINGFLVGPDFNQAFKDMLTPSIEMNMPFMLTLIALIGTTITPWGQFFIQSYVVDKGLDIKHYKIGRAEVYLGAFITNTIAFFIIISTAATLYKHGIPIINAGDAARALEPLAGQLAQGLFAFGLFAASMLGAFILPTATAYAICEAFGWEAGFNTNWKEAPFFYSIILLCLIIPALIVLLPKISLVKIMIWSQDINGILLPLILIFVMKIINDKRVMGKYANKLWGNIIAWVTIGGIIAATGALVIFSVMGYNQ